MEEGSPMFECVPPDYVMSCSSVQDAMPLQGYDLVAGGANSATLDAGMALEDIPDSLLSEAEILLQANFPELVLSPGKLGASEHPQGLAITLEEEELSLGVECQGGVPSSAKAGSQAFDYVGTEAVLETYGTPVLSRLTLLDHSATDLKPCGTLTADPKPATVPGRDDGATIYLSLPCGTLDKDHKLMQVPKSAITFSRPYGTLKIDHKLMEVPDETSIGTFDPCGTIQTNTKITIVPKNTTNIGPFDPCGTIQTDTKITIVPEETTIPDEDADTTGPRKKRRRRRRPLDDDEEAPKARLYQQGPLTDLKEERRRKDAIRAKNCREKNRNAVASLREEVEEAVREKDRWALEAAARQEYEAELLKMLWEERGIIVTPFVPGEKPQIS